MKNKLFDDMQWALTKSAMSAVDALTEKGLDSDVAYAVVENNLSESEMYCDQEDDD